MLLFLTFQDTDFSRTMYIETYRGRKSTVIKTLRVFFGTTQSSYISRRNEQELDTISNDCW